MVAGDLVNTAARLQSVAPPGAVLVGEATQRAASKAIAFEAAGEQVLKGKASPVPAWRALRVVVGTGRSQPRRRPGGAVRRPRRRAPAAQGALPRDRRASSGRGSCQRHRAGGHRQDPPRLGVPQVRRRPRRDRLVARRPLARPTATGSRFWALGEMVRGRCGLLETDDEPTTRAKVAETLADARPRSRASGAGSSPRCWRCSAIEIQASGPSSCSGPGGRSSSAWRRPRPWSWSSRTSTSPTPGLLDFVDHLLEWSRSVPIYVVTLARPELLEKRPDWGVGKRALQLALPRAALRRRRCGSCWPGSCRACPSRPSRPIVSRADGIPLYAVETVRMLLAEGRLGARGRRLPPGRRPGHARRARDAHRAHRVPSRRPRARRSGARVRCGGPRPELHARRPVGRLGHREPPSSSRGSRGLVRREILAIEADPRSPGARPVRLRPGAHPGGRLRHALAEPTARRATSPPPASSSRSARTSSPAASRVTTSPPTRTRPRVPSAMRSPPRPGSPCAAAAERAFGLGVARAGGRVPTSRR